MHRDVLLLMSICCFNEQLLCFGAALLERPGTDPLRSSGGTALTLAQDMNEIQGERIRTHVAFFSVEHGCYFVLDHFHAKSLDG